MPISEAAKHGEFFVTVTGNRDVIRGEHYDVMKDGAILVQCRTFRCGGQQAGAGCASVSQADGAPQYRRVQAEGRTQAFTLAEGRLVNLGAGDGHPAEIMDMTFALQALSLKYVNDNYKSIGVKVENVPYELDEQVARYKLESLGISIDSLTQAQVEYLDSWNLND